MGSDLIRSESDLLVFISSVMRDELNHARKLTVHAFRAFPITRPWAFEFTPASSEPPAEAYLRKVEKADFVVWLIGRETTQPVANEINTCISAGRRLLAFKLPSEGRDACTRNLIDRVSGYAKWRDVENIEGLPEHINAALSDEFVRGIRDPASPARVHKLRELCRLSVSRCKRMWIALGVPDGIAIELSEDQSIGDMLEWPNQGLHMVVGDQGAGKTLALERLFQRLVKRALDDSSQPFPLFVSARDLREPLIEYVERMSQGYSQPSVQGTSILVDGLDEIGVTDANTLLERVAEYTDVNSNATAIVTSRPLPGLKSTGEQVAMPSMDDEHVISLVSRVSGRKLDMRDRYAWSDSVWEAAKRPLFAVIIGSELRRNPAIALPRPSELVNRLVERTWQEAGDNAEVVDELLQKLAVQAISTGARASLSNVTHRKLQQRWLTDSRLVNERAGTVDFTIPIFREWYAARALIEQTASVEDILPASDRWIIPLRACTTLLLGEGYTSGPDVVLGRPTRAQQCYPTDLTAAQWAQWAPLLPPPGIGPPLRHEQRVLGNAILQVLRSGCPWRLRPHDFPPWSTVYQHCRKWRDEGLWAEGMHAVRHQERQRRDRALAPRAVISDSQSVKTTAKGGGRVAALAARG